MCKVINLTIVGNVMWIFSIFTFFFFFFLKPDDHFSIITIFSLEIELTDLYFYICLFPQNKMFIMPQSHLCMITDVNIQHRLINAL